MPLDKLEVLKEMMGTVKLPLQIDENRQDLNEIIVSDEYSSFREPSASLCESIADATFLDIDRRRAHNYFYITHQRVFSIHR